GVFLRHTFGDFFLGKRAAAEPAGLLAEPETAPAPPPPDAGAPDPNAGWVIVPEGTQRVFYAQGQVGPANGSGLVFKLGIPASRRYRMRYEVMPEGAFDFVHGGK